MTLSRADILGSVSGDGVWVHCISRCVRRAYLCGSERGKTFDHRKDWIEQRLRLLGEQGAVEVASYAVMSNHLHVVLRVRSDWTLAWSAQEVAQRYLTLFPKDRGDNGFGVAPTPEQVAVAAKGPRIAVWRGRLGHLGWLMRALKEPISRRANKEDGCSGAFWEGRFTSVPLLDQAALIACMAYVDLNPIRAKVVDRPERSTHTSIRTRIRARQGFQAQQTLRAAGQRDRAVALATKAGLTDAPRHQEDGLWLAPLRNCVSGSPDRPDASPLTSDEYLTLVDATGKILRQGKRGRIPPELLPILQRLDLDLNAWLATMQGWREFLGRVVGSLAARAAAALTLQGRQWFQNRCTLFASRPGSSAA